MCKDEKARLGEMLKKDTSDTEGLSKIYKRSLKFYIRKQTTQLKNRPRPEKTCRQRKYTEGK